MWGALASLLFLVASLFARIAWTAVKVGFATAIFLGALSSLTPTHIPVVGWGVDFANAVEARPGEPGLFRWVMLNWHPISILTI